MPTLGEELKRRREERQISLTDISEATRIGTRFLKAIEADNFSVLPGGIFTRSFIRAYAREIGMDEDEAISLYQQQATGQATPEGQPAPPASSAQPTSAEQRTRQATVIEQQARVSAEERKRKHEPVTYRPSGPRTNWSTVIIVGGIALFVIIIVVALVKQLNRSTGENAPPIAQANRNAQTTTPPTTAPTPPLPTSTTPTQTPPTTTPEAPPSVPQGEMLTVKLEATTGDSYIQFQVDDAKPTRMLLKQGQSQDLPPAQNQIKLNYGNRLALKLKINNREATFPAEAPKFGAQVTISRDNLQTYFQ
jgi:cytoskeleton protein RodZ